MSRRTKKAEREEQQVAVWLKSDLKDYLAETAAQEGRSQKAILEDAIEGYRRQKAAAHGPAQA